MKGRFEEILSVIPKSEVFADIGCDHGYMAKAVLDSGKCKKAIVADVSALCLQKAQALLAEYAAEGRVESYVADGFDGLPPVDCALIAGMGGEEIIAILKKAQNLPESLVLQPMKNSPKVRETVVALGYRIVKDWTFVDGKKYYDLMHFERGEDVLTEDEKEFGRTNVIERPQGFKSYLTFKIAELERIAESPAVSEVARAGLYSRIERMKKYV